MAEAMAWVAFARLPVLARIARQTRAAALAAGELIFIATAPAGAALGVMLLLLTPRAALCSVLALIGAWSTAGVCRRDKEGVLGGAPAFNALLVGLAVAHLWPQGAWAYALAVAGGAGVFLLCAALESVFESVASLPLLSLPFVLTSALMQFFAPPGAAGLASWRPPGDFAWVEHALGALGGLFYLPFAESGAVIAALLLMHSRILFLLALSGYVLGTAIHVAMGGLAGDAPVFNYPLVAMAIGGAFLRPTWRSLMLAALAVAASALLVRVLQVALNGAASPLHALPYNVVTLVFLAALTRSPRSLFAPLGANTPEAAVESLALEQHRGDAPAIALPLAGNWTVWQGFDGDWTHQGPWRHGVDFVIRAEDGYTFSGNGRALTDYHCWQQALLSPVRGTVIAARGDLPDNPPGEADIVNNWGNHIILRDDRGFHVELSHLAQGSLAVSPGQRVEPGDLLGRCGNSGYAVYPHLHLQVQDDPQLGAATRPFLVAARAADGEYVFREPQQGETYALPGTDAPPLTPDWHLGETVRFFEARRGRMDAFTVRVTAGGAWYLDAAGGRLYFVRDGIEWRVTRVEGRSRLLRALALALPRLPCRLPVGSHWVDALPLSWARPGIVCAALRTAALLRPALALARYEARHRQDGCLELRVSDALGRRVDAKVSFDCFGLAEIDLGQECWRRLGFAEAQAMLGNSSNRPSWATINPKETPQ